MLTPAHSNLACALTEYYFGQTVGKVIKGLFQFDQAPLRLLKSIIPNIKLSELKSSLLLLVKYQLVDYVKTVKHSYELYEYSVVPHRLFSFFRVPQYFQALRDEINPVTRVILTLTAERGLVNKEKLLELVAEDPTCKDLPPDQIEGTFQALLTKKYIAVSGGNTCLNIENLDRRFRDNLILENIRKYYNNEQVASIAKCLLTFTADNSSLEDPMTPLVSLANLTNHLVPSSFSNAEQLQKQLEKLTKDINNKFFHGIHADQGNMYSLNVGAIIGFLVKEHLSSAINSRFGPKCCRVFKVLLMKGPLLLKQIEEIIMLPARDVREYSYMLIKNGFIRNRQVPKTPDNAPGKSVFIMSVELDLVIYDMADSCCHSMTNLLNRYGHELASNKALLEKSRELSAMNVPAGDWNQYFTTHELTELEKVNRILDRLLKARNQVDETLYLLHCWLNMNFVD